MGYTVLPKRVFNSPLIDYKNFENGSINLIKLIKPYANGMAWAVYETTNNPFCSNGLFKTEKQARDKFNLMIKNNSYSLNTVKE
jgi:hypothetical protein